MNSESMRPNIFKRITGKLFRIFEQLFTPEIKGVSIHDVKIIKEELIFPQEIFKLPEKLDIFAQKHHYFSGYTCVVPPFYIRGVKGAKCVVGREEIFTSDNEVIIEHTSQKLNPWIGKHNYNLNRPYQVNGSVANLALSGIENNYYHWLTECLGHYYLLEKSQFKPDLYILAKGKSFQRQYLEILKIDTKRIIELDLNSVVQADEVIISSLINTTKNWDHVHSRGHICYRKQWLPSWIGNLYKENIDLTKRDIIQTNIKTKIYISRAFANYRKLENEDKIIDLLISKNYGIYHLENMSVEEQIKLFSNASIVVGVHGAGFSNIYFCPQTTVIFEIFTEHYQDSSFKVLTNALGLQYHYIIGRTNNIENIHPQQENVYIDLVQLEMALDLLDSLITHHN